MSDISLREFLEQKISYEKEIVELRFQYLDAQLKTAAAELSRRLETLNHAHEASVIDRNSFVNVELYQQTLKDYATWRDTVNTTLANAAGRTAAYASVASLFVGLIVLILSRLWK